MIRVDFMRHGDADAGDALLGRSDPPLSDAGRTAATRQLAGLSWLLVVSSPLRRARETAEIATHWSGETVELDPAWREMDFGDWEGAARSALGKERLAAFYANPDAAPPPNGEPLAAVRARVTDALERLAARGSDPVLVVAHGGTIRVALSVLIGLPFERLWAIRIACATRIGIMMGSHPGHGLWGEIIEIAQPDAGEAA